MTRIEGFFFGHCVHAPNTWLKGQLPDAAIVKQSPGEATLQDSRKLN
jgi:hypothetical protein